MILVASGTPDKPISRKLAWFEKEDDTFVGEVRLENLDSATLQELFNVSEDKPMHSCYPLLTQKQVLYLQKFTFHQIDVLAYDYFLEP